MKKMIIIMSILLSISGCTNGVVPAEDFTEENQILADILPAEEGFEWGYDGFAEYGHTMTLDSINSDDEYKEYLITGMVEDPSSGEAEGDYSLEIKYEIENGELKQYIKSERMMDPSYQGIILLKAPLILEDSWQQVLIIDDHEITLNCYIAEENDTDQGKVYIVRYEDTNSEYYEIRTFKEGYGQINFAKLYQSEEMDFEISYFLR